MNNKKEWWERLDAALTAVTIGIVMLAFILFAILTSRDAMAAAQEAGSLTTISTALRATTCRYTEQE